MVKPEVVLFVLLAGSSLAPMLVMISTSDFSSDRAGCAMPPSDNRT